jgi:hypothetical protein
MMTYCLLILVGLRTGLLCLPYDAVVMRTCGPCLCYRRTHKQDNECRYDIPDEATSI